jgi:hypothetical protein
LLAAVAVIPLVIQALSDGESARIYAVSPPLWIIGIPEVLLAAWTGLGMLAFGLLWRTPAMEGLTAGTAVVAGVGLGLLPLYIARETSVVTLVITPIDSLYVYVSNPTLECVRRGPCQLSFGSALGWLREILMQHSFVLRTTPRPAIFLEWAAIAGMIHRNDSARSEAGLFPVHQSADRHRRDAADRKIAGAPIRTMDISCRRGFDCAARRFQPGGTRQARIEALPAGKQLRVSR